MGAISGEYGAIYFNEELTSTGLAGEVFFNAAGTIISTGDAINFETEGYSSGMMVLLSGCTDETANNRTFTITEIDAGILTVLEDVVTAEPETGTVTFTEAEPGIQVSGFFSWALSQTADALETTDFSDVTGGRTYIAGLKGWTASAEKYFLTANNVIVTTGASWINTPVEIRFFTKYVANTTGAAGYQAWYYKGDTVVTGIDHTTPIDALVSESISFQGDKALTFKIQDEPWSSGISA